MSAFANLTFLDDWQREFAQSYSNPEELGKVLNLDAAWVEQQSNARKLFPMRVPRPFAALIEPGNPNDPLLRQVIPLQVEFDQVPGFNQDPLEEQELSGPTGLLHKYKSRVLIVLRGGCAVNCRYCFRRHFPYHEHNVSKRELEHINTYLAQHPEVNEVILSGGDPLMANDNHLATLIQQIESHAHITRLRIHSRLPVVIPQRLTPKLTALLSASRLQTILVLHINHGNELSADLQQRLQVLKKNGIWLFNQSVLLKGVNDSVFVLTELSEKLFAAGVLPYYLHQLDRVEGAAHFEVSEAEGQMIMQGLLRELPGFLVPKWVRENGGEQSKTPLAIFN